MYICVCVHVIYIMLFMLFLCLANRNTVSSYFIMLFTHFPICRLASPWLHSAMPQVPAHRSRSKCPTHSPLNAWELHRSRHRNPRTNTWEHSQVEIVTMLLHVAVWLPWFRRISHKEPQLFANQFVWFLGPWFKCGGELKMAKRNIVQLLFNVAQPGKDINGSSRSTRTACQNRSQLFLPL